jgi:hypothetical protein
LIRIPFFPAIRDVHDFELAAHAVGNNFRRVLAWLRALFATNPNRDRQPLHHPISAQAGC